MNKKEFEKRLNIQISHSQDCQDTDGTKKGFIQGLEFVKNNLLPNLTDSELNIAVNNGLILGVELDNERQKIIITEKDNNKTAKTEITAADFITMLNWYTYQKQIGNKNLMF